MTSDSYPPPQEPRPGVPGQPPETRIRTARGWVELASLLPGTEVCAAQGGMTRVARVRSHGRGPVGRLHFTDGRTALAGEGQHWQVFAGNQRSAQRVTTGQIHAVLNLQVHAVLVSVPLTYPALASQVPGQVILPTQGFLVGALLRNGKRDPETGAIRLDSPCALMPKFLRHSLPGGYRLYPERGDWCSFTIASSARRVTGAYGGKLAERLHIAPGHPEAEIPRAYLEADSHVRREVFKGFLMGFMHYELGREQMNIRGVTQRLGHSLQELVWSLGGIAEVLPFVSGKGKIRDPKVQVCIEFESFEEFAYTREDLAKACEYTSETAGRRRAFALQIVAIEPAGEAELHTVELEDTTQCYLTDDYVVVPSACGRPAEG